MARFQDTVLTWAQYGRANLPLGFLTFLDTTTTAPTTGFRYTAFNKSHALPKKSIHSAHPLAFFTPACCVARSAIAIARALFHTLLIAHSLARSHTPRALPFGQLRATFADRRAARRAESSPKPHARTESSPRLAPSPRSPPRAAQSTPPRARLRPLTRRQRQQPQQQPQQQSQQQPQQQQQRRQSLSPPLPKQNQAPSRSRRRLPPAATA